MAIDHRRIFTSKSTINRYSMVTMWNFEVVYDKHRNVMRSSEKYNNNNNNNNKESDITDVNYL